VIYEFVDYFKGIRVGDKIKIKLRHIPPCSYKAVPVSNNFVNYIRANGNCFVVRSIQEIDDDNAMIGVEEVTGALEYYQVERYITSKRIINSGGK